MYTQIKKTFINKYHPKSPFVLYYDNKKHVKPGIVNLHII